MVEFCKAPEHDSSHRMLFQWVKIYFETGSPPSDFNKSSDLQIGISEKDAIATTDSQMERTQRSINSYPPLYLQGKGYHTHVSMYMWQAYFCRGLMYKCNDGEETCLCMIVVGSSFVIFGVEIRHEDPGIFLLVLDPMQSDEVVK